MMSRRCLLAVTFVMLLVRCADAQNATAAKMSLANQGNVDLKVFEVVDGKEQLRAVLKPHQDRTFDTFLGKSWVVRNAGNGERVSRITVSAVTSFQPISVFERPASPPLLPDFSWESDRNKLPVPARFVRADIADINIQTPVELVGRAKVGDAWYPAVIRQQTYEQDQWVGAPPEEPLVRGKKYWVGVIPVVGDKCRYTSTFEVLSLRDPGSTITLTKSRHPKLPRDVSVWARGIVKPSRAPGTDGDSILWREWEFGSFPNDAVATGTIYLNVNGKPAFAPAYPILYKQANSRFKSTGLAWKQPGGSIQYMPWGRGRDTNTPLKPDDSITAKILVRP